MNKIVLVTGASRGIGYETALTISRMEGYHVVAVARNEKSLQQLQKKGMRNGKSNIDILAGDLTSETFRKLITEKFNSDYKRLDILINNAGSLINAPFEELKEEDLKQQFAVNVIAPALLVRDMLPFMLNREAHVVSIGSMGGFQGSAKFSGLAAYSSSKAAIAVMTECLAEEYKEKGVRFNCLALGAVQTEMLEEAFPGFKAPVSPEEMGKHIADFSIEGSKYYNGKVIPVSVNTP